MPWPPCFVSVPFCWIAVFVDDVSIIQSTMRLESQSPEIHTFLWCSQFASNFKRINAFNSLMSFSIRYFADIQTLWWFWSGKFHENDGNLSDDNSQHEFGNFGFVVDRMVVAWNWSTRSVGFVQVLRWLRFRTWGFFQQIFDWFEGTSRFWDKNLRETKIFTEKSF